MTQHHVAVHADNVEHLLDDHGRVDRMIERVSGICDVEPIVAKTLDQMLAVETRGPHGRHDVRLGEQTGVAVRERIDGNDRQALAGESTSDYRCRSGADVDDRHVCGRRFAQSTAERRILHLGSGVKGERVLLTPLPALRREPLLP
jgi:hypothetical protein